MGLNVDLLREGLTNYKGSLEQHLVQLNGDFEVLMNTYAQFANEYEGTAAEEFKMHWEMTAQWFTEYISISESLARTLEERIRFIENV